MPQFFLLEDEISKPDQPHNVFCNNDPTHRDHTKPLIFAITMTIKAISE